MTSAHSGAQCRIEASSGSVIDKVLRNCKEQTLRDHICCPLHVLSARGAARGGEASPYGWTSKNYVICVCFHCHGSSSYHTTYTLQGVEQRATLIHRQYNRDWETSYSRPPIDQYFIPPRYKILAAPLLSAHRQRNYYFDVLCPGDMFTRI